MRAPWTRQAAALWVVWLVAAAAARSEPRPGTSPATPGAAKDVAAGAPGTPAAAARDPAPTRRPADPTDRGTATANSAPLHTHDAAPAAASSRGSPTATNPATSPPTPPPTARPQLWPPTSPERLGGTSTAATADDAGTALAPPAAPAALPVLVVLAAPITSTATTVPRDGAPSIPTGNDSAAVAGPGPPPTPQDVELVQGTITRTAIVAAGAAGTPSALEAPAGAAEAPTVPGNALSPGGTPSLSAAPGSPSAAAHTTTPSAHRRLTATSTPPTSPTIANTTAAWVASTVPPLVTVAGAPTVPSRPKRLHLPSEVSVHPELHQLLLSTLSPDTFPDPAGHASALRQHRGGVASAGSSWPNKMAAVVEGDLVLGGLMMVHEREDTVVCGPIMPQGGVQALEAMLFTLDAINGDKDFLPGVTLGAHILDDCDKDTYGLEMAVDFIKGSISNIDDAEVQCNQSAARKVISGVVGAASSVTSIQVANLLRLFRIPQVSFFSTSPELSNKQRFEFFSRTIPSDHHQVAAMVEIVKRMNWTYVSIVYEESNYGIKAYEELERVLALRNVCIAVKEKLEKDSGVADEESYDKIVDNLLSKPRARGVIIFASDQEVAGVMRAVRRKGATGRFSWIGSDGWSARSLVSDGNEPEVEGTLSVQPQANPVRGFEDYFLGLTPDNNRRNPWFVEFWEAHFHCRYNNSPVTPYNTQWSEPCAPDLRLNKNNTDFEGQLQFVSDAVMAFAHALRQMHLELCEGQRGLCDAMQPTEGNTLLGYLRNVSFTGLSGDKFQFDRNGDGPARYNIIHFKQVEPGRWSWVRVGEYSGNELHLNMSEIQFQLESPSPPVSVCSLPCAQGQARRYVERESCCWHCFNCTQYQVRNESDETRCDECPMGTLPDALHTRCIAIPEDYLQADSGWAIGAMAFSCFGIVTTVLVLGVFVTHHDTPVVRASGRELSYVLLTGILLCYCVTFLLVLKPTDTVCGMQRFSAGSCFTMVYAALFIKTNRIARIFQAGKRGTKRPSLISPRSQLIICGGLVLVQFLINLIWMLLSPAAAVHMYPTREDNVLVCSSHKDASYMIAFGYPIMLILVCTVYAVLTRKIPGAFNESQHIGFTMYTTCIIWLAFVPLFFATANHVALRITCMSVTISLSAFVTVACLFTPKLYIIVFHPERNVRQSMMPKMSKLPTTMKSSAATASTAVRPAVPTAAIAAPASATVPAPKAGPGAAVSEKQHKATQSDDPPLYVANGGVRMSRSQQTSLQDLHDGEQEPGQEQGGGAWGVAPGSAPDPEPRPAAAEAAASADAAPTPKKGSTASATDVITANPARLSSLDYIDMDVERLVQSPPPPTPPAAANNVCSTAAADSHETVSDTVVNHHAHSNHNHNHNHSHHRHHHHHHHHHNHHHANHHRQAAAVAATATAEPAVSPNANAANGPHSPGLPALSS